MIAWDKLTCVVLFGLVLLGNMARLAGLGFTSVPLYLVVGGYLVFVGYTFWKAMITDGTK